MKILHLPLLVCLAVLCLQSQQVQSENRVDILLEALTKTLPCLPPCVFENLPNIISDFNRDCMPQLQENIRKVAQSIPRPPPRGPGPRGPGPRGPEPRGPGPRRPPPPAQPPRPGDLEHGLPHGVPVADMNMMHVTKAVCNLYKETAKCAATISRKYCGADLTNALLGQFKKYLEYMPCGAQGPKAKVFQCATGQEAMQVVMGCIETVKRKHPEFPSRVRGNYVEIYDKFLVSKAGTTDPPKICDIADTFKQCVTNGLKQGRSAECPAETVKLIEDEFNSILDHVNCRTYRRTNDALTCLANPSLLFMKISPCIYFFNYTNLAKVFIPPRNPSQPPTLELKNACDAITLVDTCIEANLKKEPACLDDGWTLSTYRALNTPSRDFLINEYCQNLGKTPSNPVGAGTCKNTFADYTYGEEDPSGASKSHRGHWFHFTHVLMWVMDK